jgi:hypothetical protein
VAGTVIDSFMIALGFKVDPAGLKDVRKQADQAKESLLGVGTALKTFVAGFAIKEIADIGSTFEQNQNQIAGFLSGLGQSSDFNAGLEDAQGVIQQITKDAAKLPGEAQEYIEVFKAGYPFVQQAMPGGSLHQITDFTNQLTAIGKSFSLDSGLIAREFDHMLSPGRGMASLRLPLFRQLLNFMPKMQNGARVTAESFNAMSAPQRLALLQATFAKLQPMLEKSATSFDAMWGAAVSAIKQITRLATVPLFKAMKKGLDALNATFFDADNNLTDFGKGFVSTAKTIIGWIGQILGMGGAFVSWLVHSKVGMVGLKLAAIAVGLALAGMALEGTIGTIGKMVKAIGNWKRALMGGLFIALVLIAEDIYTFIKGGDSLVGKLLHEWPVAFTVVTALLGTLGLAFVAVKVAALASFAQVAASAVSAAATAAAAWLPVLAPFLVIAAAVAGLIKLMDALDERFAVFKRARMEVYDALGVDMRTHESPALAGFNAAPGFQRSGAAPEDSFLRKPAPGFVPYSPAVVPTGGAGAAAAGGGTTVHQTTIQKVEIHSNSDQPQQVARETAREITRNAQKGYR